MYSGVVELSMIVLITPLLALGVACFDATWCRKIVSVVEANLGKIWMAGSVVAAFMFITGVGFGILHSLMS